MNQAITIGCGASVGFVLHPRIRVHIFDEANSPTDKLALLGFNKGESIDLSVYGADIGNSEEPARAA